MYPNRSRTNFHWDNLWLVQYTHTENKRNAKRRLEILGDIQGVEYDQARKRLRVCVDKSKREIKRMTMETNNFCLARFLLQCHKASPIWKKLRLPFTRLVFEKLVLIPLGIKVIKHDWSRNKQDRLILRTTNTFLKQPDLCDFDFTATPLVLKTLYCQLATESNTEEQKILKKQIKYFSYNTINKL